MTVLGEGKSTESPFSLYFVGTQSYLITYCFFFTTSTHKYFNSAVLQNVNVSFALFPLAVVKQASSPVRL